METILISDDFYLASGLMNYLPFLRWLQGEDALNHIFYNNRQPSVLIIDPRTSVFNILCLKTRWTGKDYVLRLLMPSMKKCLPICNSMAVIDLTLCILDLLKEISRVCGNKLLLQPCQNCSVFLSEKETQIFGMLLSGTSEIKIASEMGLSIKSIYGYRSRVVKKYGYGKYYHFYYDLIHSGQYKPKYGIFK